MLSVVVSVYLIGAKDASGFWPFSSTKSASATEMSSSNVAEDDIIIINQSYVLPIVRLDSLAKNQWQYYPPTTKRIILPCDTAAWHAGQCVCWVKTVTGVDFSGNANVWVKYVDTYTPSVGAIVVLKTGNVGHVGIVVKVTKDTITVRSRNYQGLWIVSDDEFQRDDSIILGYIKGY